MGESVRVVWPAMGRVELEEYEAGEPREDEVLIRTEYTLISPGTELAFLHALPNTPGRYPQYPGYNNVGRIAKLGSEVQGFAEGARVISNTKHASLIVAPSSTILKVPNALSSEEAVYFNMASISLQAVRKAGVELGEAVLVMGQGIIGNLALQLAKLSGALPVVGADLLDERLAISKECGADLCVNLGREDLAAALRQFIGRDWVEAVLDATGVPEAILDCLRFTGNRGRVVLLASTRGETETVNFYRDVHRRGIAIIGAHDSVRPNVESSKAYWTRLDDWAVVLRLMAASRLAVEPLTTDVLSFQEAAKAYELLASAKREHLGIVLDWR